MADDINKLPDTNTAEALERITGIQVGINAAEIGGNGGVEIRGLTQIEDLVDGREVFTAGGTASGGVGAGTRTFNFGDLPSALVAGIDVYKTAAADQPEGGLGGLVNVRLHKPFDFPGLEAALTVGTTYESLEGQDKPNYNFLFSDTWNVGEGKLGLLVNAAYTVIPWREDNIGMGNPTPANTGLVTGATGTTDFPSGYTAITSQGLHQHTGVNVTLQWAPNKNLELYAGGNYEEYWIRQNSYEMSLGLTAAEGIAGSGVLFPGDPIDIMSASFSNVTGTSFGITRDVVDQERQYFIGGKWTHGDLTVKLDLDREDYDYGFYNNGVYGSVVIPTATFNVSSAIPTGYTYGISLLDPSQYKLVQVYNRVYPSAGYQTAGFIDAEYKIPGGVITSIEAGVRYAGNENDNGLTGLFLGSYNLPANTYFGAYPSLYGANPIHNYFDGYKNQTISQYLTPVLTNMRNANALLAEYGDTVTTASNDATINPLSLFHIDEADSAIYVMPKFAFKVGNFPIDGNFGVRAARTDLALRGFQTAYTSTNTAYDVPLTQSTSYTKVLPSFNARVKLSDTLFVRAAVSKTLTRQQFSSLSPSLTLNANPVNPSLNTGSAGNPSLAPYQSTNYDLSVEKYFSKTTSVYLAGFDKQVTGYTVSVGDQETWNGLTYLVSRPYALNKARIKGGEIGYQQFFDFLPAPLDGFGAQLNFTYVDSNTPLVLPSSSVPAGISGPIASLSRDSYNLILMYEKGIFSARIAYNYRSKFFNSYSGFVGIGEVPQFTKGYGELDGSLNFAITKNITLNFQGQNLTNTLRETYWTSLNRPSNYYLDGINLMASVTFRL